MGRGYLQELPQKGPWLAGGFRKDLFIHRCLSLKQVREGLPASVLRFTPSRQIPVNIGRYFGGQNQCRLADLLYRMDKAFREAAFC